MTNGQPITRRLSKWTIDKARVELVEVATGEFSAYVDDDLVAELTTRPDGVRLLWNDAPGDGAPALRADPRRFADVRPSEESD